MATAKKKAGRPSRLDGEKLERLTVNLPPKLRFGLDLLARAQHRSLSQALEWALQRGLHSYEVGIDMQTIGDVLDKAWAKPTDAQRHLAIYRSAPALLAFEEFVTCELIDRSYEYWTVIQEQKLEMSKHLVGANLTNEELAAEGKKISIAEEEMRQTYDRFVDAFWPLIREKAVERANSGIETTNNSVLGLLHFKIEGMNHFEVMKQATKHFKELLKNPDNATAILKL